MVAFTEPNTEPAASATGPHVLRRKALRALGDLPPFSATLNRLMASLAGESVSFSQIGDLIEKDTIVAGNILHLVNSALYARRGTINSVRHALSILGLDKIRNAVLGMSLTRMWTKLPVPASWSMAKFNLHSAATALLSDQLAPRLHIDYPEGAFVAGLMHDIGRLLIAMTLTPQHEQIRELHRTTGASLLDCEMEVLGFTHAMLSADAVAVWNIPEPIRLAVLHHHDHVAETLLSRIVEAADHYVDFTALAVCEPDSEDSQGIGTLALDEDTEAAVLREFRAEFDVMSQFFH